MKQIFNKIEKPWFKFDMHEDGYMVEGEDAWFCSQAKKQGYKIYCDGTIPVGHLGDYEFKAPEKEPLIINKQI
jgi:hypothetical protein